MSDKPETTTEFRVRCGDCDHRWVAAYLPMGIREFARIGKRLVCPKCAALGARIFVDFGEEGAARG